MKREALLSRLEQSMLDIGKGMHEQLRHSEYSPAQNHVLMIIGIEGEMGIKQLAEVLHVTSGAATQHVDALEKAGLLERSMSSNDRRGVIVKITPHGSTIFQEIRQTKARMLGEVFSELDDHELQTLVGLIEKVSRTTLKSKDSQHAKIR